MKKEENPMNIFKKLFEKSSFNHLYVAFEKNQSERGFGKMIHFFKEKPSEDEFTQIMRFPEMIEYLQKNPIDDLYFFGPIRESYWSNKRFKWYIDNRNLGRYFN